MREDGCTITTGQMRVSSGSDRTVKGPLYLSPEHIERVPQSPGVYILGDIHWATVAKGSLAHWSEAIDALAQC